MADTRLSDVIVPSVFTPYIQLNSTEKTELWESGVITTDAVLTSQLSGGGRTFNVPGFNDLAQTESAISSDDPAAVKVPEKIGTHADIAIRHNRNQAWSVMDLVSQLAGANPMTAIANRVAAYWARQFQKMVISSVTGILLRNVASNGGDMLVNVYVDQATPTAAQSFTATNFEKAVQTMGDMAEGLGIVVMHSATYRRAEVDNLIQFIPNARGEIMFRTYLGRRVIVDDGMPAVAGTNTIAYDTYIVGPGAFAFGEGVSGSLVPTEVWRNPATGNGAGQEILYNRRQFIMHPRGHAFQIAGSAGQSPTNTELALAAAWARVYPQRKQIPIAVLRHGLVPL